ncbi:YcaQ family DNA glycosylase [Tessaracoccus sp. MC1865]|uniref:winged helix-turn-helix domain-containing protein n=1 Tax=unclassified Tessaracoccus TaxID=2635419 RepID=UPI0015FFEF00|nr:MULTISPECIES: crosslink repair DNA glycosylase YcaQ family protein [unclassified Tessaracoccus]MBB1483634.1 YcaQ family DNA glycosylase [Tessaracoccus sp. MC1865]MBB1508856.1 YcaQ family DNA glycosylase [Tessaracoccus sp. MC1756]QTO36711.1 YcaQ family DNA glycosylase [Tessaracoccus sp. MC1865]
MPRRLSPAAARRIAVDAQGLGRPRKAAVGPAALRAVVARLGVLQLDTVNVFERSHYLPLLSRLGPYDRAVLDRLVHHDQRATRLGSFTEYLSHEAAIMPVADWPLWAWHRARPERPGWERWAQENGRLIDEVLAEFHLSGPMRVRDLHHPLNAPTSGGWWNKNDVYWAASRLFRKGDIVVVGRDRFERVYGVAGDVLPPEARVAVPEDEAVIELVRRASVAHGVATLEDLADYPRIKRAPAQRAVDVLVARGELEPVEVDGWARTAWLATGQRVPRSVTAAALLSPFDPLVWFRPRAERVFGFRYRISIYTPAEQREHGYYVLPVLVDDELVGRVDLKADRQAGVLRVQHAHVEPASAHRREELAARVAPLLAEAAEWQGLGSVSFTGPGTWVAALKPHF